VSRPGLTLLEVIVSTAIFLMALVAIARLTMMGSALARDAQTQTDALQLAQAKMAEVVSGVTPLNAQSDTALDPSQTPSGQDGWTWSMDCNANGSITNASGQTMVWTVRITVRRPRPDGSVAQVMLSQMVLDPAVRGSTQNSNSNSGSSGSGSTSGSGG
jgi:type II secretory pathway pseudopilin PulG